MNFHNVSLSSLSNAFLQSMKVTVMGEFYSIDCSTMILKVVIWSGHDRLFLKPASLSPSFFVYCIFYSLSDNPVYELPWNWQECNASFTCQIDLAISSLVCGSCTIGRSLAREMFGGLSLCDLFNSWLRCSRHRFSCASCSNNMFPIRSSTGTTSLLCFLERIRVVWFTILMWPFTAAISAHLASTSRWLAVFVFLYRLPYLLVCAWVLFLCCFPFSPCSAVVHFCFHIFMLVYFVQRFSCDPVLLKKILCMCLWPQHCVACCCHHSFNPVLVCIAFQIL